MNNTETSTPNTKTTTDERVFRVPSALAEDLAFSIETMDADVLKATILKHRVVLDTFRSDEVDHGDEVISEKLPVLRVVTVSANGMSELMVVVPASMFDRNEGVELALRVLSSGRAYTDRSAISVVAGDDRELLLFGGWDKSPSEVAEAERSYVLGFHVDHPTHPAPISKALH